MTSRLYNENLESLRQKKPVRRRVLKPGGRLLAVLAVFLLVYVLFTFCTQFNRLYAMQRDVSNLEQEMNQLKEKNTQLRQQLDMSQSSAYVEGVAREKLGLVKPGESRILPVPPAAGN